MKEPKNVQKSIRITEKVAEYIEQQNGEGFNEKLCNMVMYCMEKESELKKSIEYYEKQLERYQNEIERYQNEIDKKRAVVSKLRSIEQYVNSCCRVIQ